MAKKWLLCALAVLVTLLIAVVIAYATVDNKPQSSPTPTVTKTYRAFTAYDIKIGMTKDEVRKICGWPDDQDTYKSAYGIYSTFIYERPLGKLIIVKFENGLVTSVGEY